MINDRFLLGTNFFVDEFDSWNILCFFSFTTRVSDLIGVLADVNKGNCVRTGINHTTIAKRNDQGQIRTQDGIIK